MSQAHQGVLNEHIHYAPSTPSSVLSIDGNPLTTLGDRYGTPSYFYSEDCVLDGYRAIRDAFVSHHNNVSIHFSVKANNNPTILKALLAAGASVDCVSKGEIHRALTIGCPSDRIVFAGSGKRLDEIEFALNNRIGWFNCENELEIEYISECAERLGVKETVNVAIRLNPDVKANTIAQISTGHSYAKFGLDEKTVYKLLENSTHGKYYSHVHLNGLHVHIGSQLGDAQKTRDALQKAVSLAKQFPVGAITTINIGGGFPVCYDDEAAATLPPLPSVERFASLVGPLARGYHLLMEPGRRIVAPAGVLLTRVLYLKEQASQQMLIVDASMTELMRPALYGAHHTILSVVKDHGDTRSSSMSSCGNSGHDTSITDTTDATLTYVVVGPVCESTDSFGTINLSPQAAVPGTLLAIMTAGAYGYTMAHNYNARVLPPQVVVRTSTHEPFLSTRRQELEDLLRCEEDI